MKVSYYAVYMENFKKKLNKRVVFKDIVNDIISIQKSKRASGKTLPQFISHIHGDVYLFVKINDSEILKKVNTSNLSVDDLQKILNTNEKLGFTSYFIIKDNVIGYGCTLFSSKMSKFREYINDNFNSSIDERIEFEPLVTNVTKADALKLKFIGKTTVRVDSTSGLFNTLATSLCLKGVDEKLIDGIEIVIKPTRGENIKNPINRLTNQFANDVDEMKYLAREELADQAREIYLDNNVIHNNITYKKSHDIPHLMEKFYIKSKDGILDKLTVLFKKLKI